MGRNNKQRRAQKKLNRVRRARENKKERAKEANKPLGPALQLISNPFAGLDDDARKQMVHEIAQNSEKTYQESLAKIENLLRRYDPLTLLSIIASYGLTVPVSENGIQRKDGDSKIHQAHLEIYQSLALRIKPEDMQEMVKIFQTTSKGF